MRMPTRDEITQILFDLEDDANSAGWDTRPALGLISRYPVDDKIVSAFAILTLPIYEPVPVGLTFLADKLHDEAPSDAVAAMIDEVPIILGIALISEVYTYDPVDAADQERIHLLRQQGYTIADIPGAVECRMVLAVDVAGQGYRIMRRRGAESTDLSAEGVQSVSAEALRKLLLAFIRNRPDNAASRPILEGLSFLVDEDTSVLEVIDDPPNE